VNSTHEQTTNNGSMLAVLDSRAWDTDLSVEGGILWNPGAFICANVDNSAGRFINNADSLSCNIPDAIQNVKNGNDWTVALNASGSTFAYQIDHCLSEIIPEKCQVNFTLQLMIVVVVCNVAKFACMTLATYTSTREPLVVIGDTIASFLERKEEKTKGLCLSNLKSVGIPGPSAQAWSGQKQRWYLVARESWLVTLIL
jgi:hypothetical protein